jgi:O-antigen/teichoic acid export membrane protein
VGGYGAQQVIRFALNVVLTRLLAPQIFGLLTVLSTLRTGMELLTDIGIGQNVVSSRNGDDPKFLATAWTLQLVRGPILAVIFCLAAWPLSRLYTHPDMMLMLMATSTFILVGGIMSVGRWTAQRHQQLARLAQFEVIIALVQAVLMLVSAYIWPNAWSIIWAMTGGVFFAAILSFFWFPSFKPTLAFDSASFREILNFGKWIFASSILYFTATNFDRLYLGAAIPLAVFGVYGVARSMAEIIATLVTHVGNLVVFPTVAAARDDLVQLRIKLLRSRRPLLIVAALAIAGFAAISDIIIELIYDSRYHAAGAMLPPMVLGVWFSVLTTMGEAVLLGIGKPQYGTMANSTKLIWLVCALPLGVKMFGVPGAVGAIALADAVRYVPIMWAQHREKLSFLTHDFFLTLLLFGLAIAFREITFLIGLTGGLDEWFRIFG